MTTTETKTATLFLAFNEHGDVAADMDRDTAIDRLKDDFGGHFCRVIEMTITLPVFADIKASFAVPPDKAEAVTVAA